MIEKTCMVCNSHFRVSPSRKNTAKYCSIKCRGKSLEWRRKIGEATAMRTPWNKGKPRSEELRLKMRLGLEEYLRIHGGSNKGKHISEEQKLKLRLSHLGKKLSVETKRKISEVKKGRKWAPEHRAKALEGRRKFIKEHPGFLAGPNNPMYGSKRPDISELYNTSEHRKKMLEKHTPNKAETKLIEIINGHKLPFKFVGNGEVIIANKNPDFISMDGGQKIIELWGDWWHKEIHHRVGSEDYYDPEKRKQIFKDAGYDCLIIWESELKDEPATLSKIEKFCGVADA